MRRIDPELQARLDGGATRLCRCWKVRRRDGLELGFTDHDRDLMIGGLIFRASSGMDASAVQATTGLSVDNAQAVGALSDVAVREEDIRAGKFDSAEVEHWLVDWERPELRVILFKGTFGEIRRSDGAFEVELRGLAEALNVAVGRSILRTCDRVLGDTKCRVDLDAARFAANAEVVEAQDGRGLIVSAPAGFDAGWFRHGTLSWVTGKNSGEFGVIKSDKMVRSTLRELELWQQPAMRVDIGDRCRLRAGCDKRSETCRAKFDNFLNFRGFPHIPGEDWVMAYPKDGEVHDGASKNRT